jgi:hypothetical protein
MDYQFRKKKLFVNPWQCPLVSSGVPSNSTVPEDMQALAVERGWLPKGTKMLKRVVCFGYPQIRNHNSFPACKNRGAVTDLFHKQF